MRIVSLCLAAILAWVGSVHAAEPAAPGLDFSKAPFDGGNAGPAWSVHLQRASIGVAAFRLTGPGKSPIAAGPLTSVEPVLELPVLGKLKGQYGLAGTVVVQRRARSVQVLLAPSPPGRPCQDARGKQHGQAVFIVIGALSNPEQLYYGCGDYKTP